MKNFRILALLVAIFTFSVPFAFAEYTPKVDSFDFFVDSSVSMKGVNNDFDMKNTDAVKILLSKINSMIPELPYHASMHTFSEYSTVVSYGEWSKSGMESAIAGLKFNSDRDGMGDGFLDADPEFYKMASPTAVILFSDGEEDKGINAVSEVRMLYEIKPELCVHVVSFADSLTGQALLDEIAGLKACSVSVKADDLLKSDDAIDQFVKDVFYYGADDILMLRGVNFAFDSAVLDANAKAVLGEAAELLKQSDRNINLYGWTDSSGSESYNQALSKRRAEAVKKYLAELGVDSGRMFAEGMGISRKYDNSTSEGRYMNRRTEVSF